MITASHNPAADNGYKLYWSNGCQIIAPHDRKISQHIMNNLELWDVNGKEENLENVLEIIQSEYEGKLNGIIKELFPSPPTRFLQVVYTPVHGVGQRYVDSVISSIGLPPLLKVESQCNPDPLFPTVKFPNPEEGPDVYNEAFGVAHSKSAQYVMANDPDADRFSFAEWNAVEKRYRIFNGNEIGILFAYFLRSCTVGPLAMINTHVSSQFLSSFAQHNNIYLISTHTGFKNLGNKAIELEKEGHRVIFAYEEAIGFMIGGLVHDKDGISALAVFLSWLNRTDKLCSEILADLYDKYGHFVCYNGYVPCCELALKERIFKKLGQLEAPVNLAGYTINIITMYEDAPLMAKLQLKDCQVIFRCSGTEPKLKYYSEGKDKNVSELIKMCNEMSNELLKL